MDVVVSHLHKNYPLKESVFKRHTKEILALKDLSFTVSSGESIGLIGLNGAGKSTLIKTLCGVLSPTQGEVFIDGNVLQPDSYEFKKKIGVLFGHRGQLWQDLSVLDSYDLLQKIYDLPKAVYKKRLEEFIQRFELQSFINTPLRKLSLGQRMKCEIAGCLLHEPELLLLDEATLGLDLFTRELVLREIKAIQQEKEMTLIFTSHNLDDVENLCERILILDQGEILFDDSMKKLRENYVGRYSLTICLEKLEENNLKHLADKQVALDPSRRSINIELSQEEALDFREWVDKVNTVAQVQHFELKPISFESIIKELYLKGETQ